MWRFQFRRAIHPCIIHDEGLRLAILDALGIREFVEFDISINIREDMLRLREFREQSEQISKLTDLKAQKICKRWIFGITTLLMCLLLRNWKT